MPAPAVREILGISGFRFLRRITSNAGFAMVLALSVGENIHYCFGTVRRVLPKLKQTSFTE